MVSVLFVDDTTIGLDFSRRRFSQLGAGWDTAFVPGGEIALMMMEHREVDAVIASTRLLGMSTRDFFNSLKSQNPRTARIALYDPNDRTAMLSVLSVANRGLSKSSESDELAQAVSQASRLQSRLFSEATLKVVADVGGLPSLPTTILAMDQALADEDCSLGEVADIVSGDVAMTAKVLQLVNSPFYGLRNEVQNLRQAVAYLGIAALREVALAGAAFRVFKPSGLLPVEWLAAFNAHSFAVGDAAGALGRHGSSYREASVAGTLHGLGELLVAERAPEKLLAAAEAVSKGADADEAEMEVLGTTFPNIAGQLLSQWGMTQEVVEGVACQREVWSGPARGPEVADLVRMGDIISASEAGPDPAAAMVCPHSRRISADEDYQARIGVLAAMRFYRDGFKITK